MWQCCHGNNLPRTSLTGWTNPDPNPDPPGGQTLTLTLTPQVDKNTSLVSHAYLCDLGFAAVMVGDHVPGRFGTERYACAVRMWVSTCLYACGHVVTYTCVHVRVCMHTYGHVRGCSMCLFVACAYVGGCVLCVCTTLLLCVTPFTHHYMPAGSCHLRCSCRAWPP